MGTTTTSISVTVPDGFSYVNIHLDYGLKGTTGYNKQVIGNLNNAIQSLDGPDIPDCQSYTFSNGGTQVVQSINSFKKNPGVGGLIVDGLDNPILGQTVKLRKLTQTGVQVGLTATTDEDGWYFINYKHTGSQATYWVEWFQGGPAFKSIQLRANGMAQVNFP